MRLTFCTDIVLNTRGECLNFIALRYVAAVNGSFPFDEIRSVAGRCLKSQSPRIENGMYYVNHLSYFKRARNSKLGPKRIEKMLTYPILMNTIPYGVVQISRKRGAHGAVCPDFSKQDFAHIKRIERTILDLFRGVRSTLLDPKTSPAVSCK